MKKTQVLQHTLANYIARSQVYFVLVNLAFPSKRDFKISVWNAYRYVEYSILVSMET